MRETRILEFKETITNTFLKTVSAFSNYDGGTILFGVDDDGNIKGLPDVKQACLDIENKINDNITPQPDYTLEIQNNDQTIKLTVKSGLQANVTRSPLNTIRGLINQRLSAGPRAMISAFTSSASPLSVSYTHLDVYKRQVLYKRLCLFCIWYILGIFFY